MEAKGTRGLETPARRSVSISNSGECAECGEALADHGFSSRGPGGKTVLSPCGFDVSSVPLEIVVDAVGGELR